MHRDSCAPTSLLNHLCLSLARKNKGHVPQPRWRPSWVPLDHQDLKFFCTPVCTPISKSPHHPTHTLVIPLFFAVPGLQGLTQTPPPQMSAPHWETQFPAFPFLHLHQLLPGTPWGGRCGVGSSTTASSLVPSSTPAPLQCFPQSRYVDILKTSFRWFHPPAHCS